MQPSRKYDAEVEAHLTQVAQLVALRRAESGLSLRDVAWLTGLSGPGISRIESGERSPTLRSLVVLSGPLRLRLVIADGKVVVE